MENLTPLQHCAHELRANFKRAEAERQKYQLDKLEKEGRALINSFASSFSTLFSLLIGSNIDVQADVSAENAAISLIHQQNQISIVPNSAKGKNDSWSIMGKTYKSTVPNKDFGIAADREDEHRLIIAIEEILFSAVKPILKEPVPPRLETTPALY